MPPRSAVILGTGSYAPSRILTNAELAPTVGSSDEWIRTRSGIRERRIAGPDEATSDLGVMAARRALEDARVAPADIDLLVVATLTPDMPMPAVACVIQHKLGLPTATACFDLNAACSGFIYALDTACALIASGRYHRALVIGAEKLSSIVDWKDRSTCVLFGDGAGAVVIGPDPDPLAHGRRGLLGTRLGALGEDLDLLWIPAGGAVAPASARTVAEGGHFLKMKGKEIFKIAVRAMEEAARDILEQQGVDANQIALVIPHQANLRIIEAIAQYLELPLDRFFINVDRYGNTSAASIPLALDEARRLGRIRPGDLILLVAFGAGLTYGSALVRW
ncbi:MAG TPA: beta-ketoacyl-ACP synthase III [Opitutaceae bacterium]|jgi:3-oxoacyl-[acyl-carrier-protein] synthase-3|nr:beta-ketoacyl-ACP synthase III [Opitutaceae bacterium]